MIVLESLRKSYPAKGGRKIVFDHVNAVFPTGQSVGILGRNGAGKSTLLDVISGVQAPDRGRVLTSGNISYPVGFGGGFSNNMTGVQAARFVARIYGADSDDIIRFVEDFTELGRQLHEPIQTYSSGQKSRLSFAISMAIPFDIYLVDEIGAPGDANFKTKSKAMFEERMSNADIVMVAHSMGQIRQFCTMGAVVHNERLHVFSDVEEAIALYAQVNSLTKAPKKKRGKKNKQKKAPWITRVVEGLFGRARTDE